MAESQNVGIGRRCALELSEMDNFGKLKEISLDLVSLNFRYNLQEKRARDFFCF